MRTVALFNLEDTPQEIGFNLVGLGLPDGNYTVCNVWDRDDVSAFKNNFAVELPPHSSLLFAVTPDDGTPKLLDANIKVDHVAFEGNTLSVKLAYSGAFDLRVNRRPHAIRVDGQATPLVCVPAGAGYAIEGVGSEIELIMS